jgi:hypothetical protein
MGGVYVMHGDEMCAEETTWKNQNRFEENTELHHKEKGRDNMDCIHLAQVKGLWWAFVNTAMNFQVP